MLTPQEFAEWKSKIDLKFKEEGINTGSYLIEACTEINPDVVEELLKEGADPNEINDFGTPLIRTIDFCRYPDENKEKGLRIVESLIHYGVDVNEIGGRGITPLNLAVVYNLNKILKLMIDNGGDLNLTDDDGNTPLQIALKTRAGKRVLKILEEAGATVPVDKTTASANKPVWGSKSPKIIADSEYEDMAATYQCLEIDRLNLILKKHGIDNVEVRRKICQDYMFSDSCFFDSGWFQSDEHVVWPELCFAERHSTLDGPIQNLYTMPETFVHHEYAFGDIGWYFDEHNESIDEIKNGNV